MGKARKIDLAWEAMDARYGIVAQASAMPFVTITTDQIHAMREIRPDLKFEPRLLTHYDNYEQMPEIFKGNGLALLPGAGGYIIGSFDIFQAIKTEPEKVPVKRLPRTAQLETLRPENVVNEAMGINYAEAFGIIEDFVGDKPLQATVSGRHGGGDWSYKVISKGSELTLQSSSPQIEVDGGFEGPRKVVLIEAKNKIVKEFCLRQLYFPLRAWMQRVNKPIETVFMAIAGTDIYLYEYMFPDPTLFQAVPGACMHYTCDSETIALADLVAIWTGLTAPAVEAVDVPFPQANSPIRALDVIRQIVEGDGEGGLATGKSLAEVYGFTGRQGDYYGDTAVYLGFASRPSKRGGFAATNRGRSNAALSERDRKLDFVKALLQRPVFREVFGMMMASNAVPSAADITPVVAKYRPDLSAGTPKRRASTVRTWMSWVASLAEDWI